jgi:hydroxypyruvate isomerase
VYELSACAELLFTEAGDGHAERIRAAAAAGLPAVELWGWRNKDLDTIEQALQSTGVVLQTLCTDPMTGMVNPAVHGAFLSGLSESIAVAERLGSPYLVVSAGDTLPGVADDQQRAAVVDALRKASEALEGHDVTLLLENLNSRVDHVGTFCDSTTEAIGILREVGTPQVRLLYDAYHSLIMEEQPAQVIGDHIDLLGHIQIADAPGRHEPGTGEHDWAEILGTFRRLGYTGRIGLEYRPSHGTIDSLQTISAIASSA